jgi:excisionase family DNA binding protein
MPLKNQWYMSQHQAGSITVTTRRSAMKLLSAREVAALTGIPQSSIYRMAKAGLIPAYKVGVKRRGLRFSSAELMGALAVKTVNGGKTGSTTE